MLELHIPEIDLCLTSISCYFYICLFDLADRFFSLNKSCGWCLGSKQRCAMAKEGLKTPRIKIGKNKEKEEEETKKCKQEDKGRTGTGTK